MNLPVTVLYGTLLCLVTLALALNISLDRLSTKVGLGVEVSPALHRKIRAHGNSAEWLAVVVPLLAFLELQHASWQWLHLAGGAMLALRLLHAAFMLAASRLSTLSAIGMYTVAFLMGLGSLWMRLR